MTTQQRSILIGVVLVTLLASSTVALGQGLDLLFYQAEFADIYRALGESQGLNVLVDPAVQGQGTFQLRGVSFADALNLISKHSGYAHRLEGETLLVAPLEKLLAQESKDIRYVQLQTVSPEEVLQALALIMPRSDVYVEPTGKLVVLHGSKETLDRAEELILALDNAVTPQVRVEDGRSLLAVFKELSAELGLSLVADPAIESKRIHLDVRNKNPEELIKQIQQLVPLKVEVTEHSLMVGNLEYSNQERLKVYRLNYADPLATMEALSMFVSPDKIRVDEPRKSVVVGGTDALLAEVDLFLVDFDQPAPQVLLEVWIQEMTTDALQNLGVEWKGTPQVSGGDAPIFLELEWEPWELVLAIKALEDQDEAKLLANPKIATLSGEAASIFVGDRVPVVLTAEDGTRTMEFLESGINLKVTPRISEDEYITILVQPEVSTFIWRSDSEYPQIRTREAETNVRVKNGQPIVLGGLLQEQETELITRIPFISQLPVLGKLFQWKETKKSQTEMTIFLIPRIVEGDQGVVNQGFFTPAQ